jgi:hypothetical protein
MFVPLSEPKADSVGRGCVHYDVLLAVIVLTTPGVVEATGGRGEGVIDRGGDRGRSLRLLWRCEGSRSATCFPLSPSVAPEHGKDWRKSTPTRS